MSSSDFKIIIDNINCYNLTEDKLKFIAIPIITKYMYSFLTPQIKFEIESSIQRVVDIECKHFIRDEKINKILE